MRIIKTNKLIATIILGIVLSILISCRNDKDLLVDNIPENLSKIQIDDDIKSFFKDYNL